MCDNDVRYEIATRVFDTKWQLQEWNMAVDVRNCAQHYDTQALDDEDGCRMAEPKRPSG